MIGQLTVQTQTCARPIFTSVTRGLMQRASVCDQDIASSGECEECKKEQQGTLRRAALNSSPVNEAPPIVEEVLRSPGQPLDLQTRAFMEPRFGHDFSRVRVHADTKASESARAVNALAYTVGGDVVFGSDQFALDTPAGRKLIAHELVHTLQQSQPSQSLGRSLHIDSSQSAAEHQADTVAEKAVNERQMRPDLFSVRKLSNSSIMLQRTPTFGSDCRDEFDRCRVVEPLGAANQLLNSVLTVLPPLADGTVTSGRIVDLLNVHFHDPGATATRAATVLTNFRAIKGELDSTINFNCHALPADCKAREGSVGAFTSGCSPGSEISLCDAYYNKPCVEQARILIHEMTHNILNSCRDFAYVHQSNYMTLSPEEASRNPDTYAQFAKMVFSGDPSCRNCSAETQLRPGQY